MQTAIGWNDAAARSRVHYYTITIDGVSVADPNSEAFSGPVTSGQAYVYTPPGYEQNTKTRYPSIRVPDVITYPL